MSWEVPRTHPLSCESVVQGPDQEVSVDMSLFRFLQWHNVCSVCAQLLSWVQFQITRCHVHGQTCTSPQLSHIAVLASPQPLPASHLFSSSEILLRMLYEWNHTECDPLRSTLFSSQHNSLKIAYMLWLNSSLLFSILLLFLVLLIGLLWFLWLLLTWGLPCDLILWMFNTFSLFYLSNLIITHWLRRHWHQIICMWIIVLHTIHKEPQFTHLYSRYNSTYIMRMNEVIHVIVQHR